MGCGQVTCNITRLPIQPGQRCVMIEFNRNPLRDGYMFPEEPYQYVITRVLKGEYDDYGWFEGEEEKEEERDNYRIFILESAWDQIVKLYPRQFTEEELVALKYVDVDLEKEYEIISAFHAKYPIEKFQEYNNDPEYKKAWEEYHEHSVLWLEASKYDKKIRLFKVFGEYAAEWLSVDFFMAANRINYDSWFNSYSQSCNIAAFEDRMAITQKCLEELKQDILYDETDNEPIEDPDGTLIFSDHEKWSYLRQESQRDVFCFSLTGNMKGPYGWWSKGFAELKRRQGEWAYCTEGGILYPDEVKADGM